MQAVRVPTSVGFLLIENNPAKVGTLNTRETKTLPKEVDTKGHDVANYPDPASGMTGGG